MQTRNCLTRLSFDAFVALLILNYQLLRVKNTEVGIIQCAGNVIDEAENSLLNVSKPQGPKER